MKMTPSERTKKWNLENPERYRANIKASRQRIKHNPARLKRHRESVVRYYRKHPEKFRQWRENNEWAKIADRCRGLIRAAMYCATSRGPKVEALLGCTVFEFRAMIQRKWKPGMNWENYGRNGWTIGHKKAVVKFKEVLNTEAGRLACFHYSNLMPEWAWRNYAKYTGNTLTKAQIQLGKLRATGGFMIDEKLIESPQTISR